MNTPLFRLGLLSLTLAVGFAHVENETKDSIVFDTATIKGQATNATHHVTAKRMEETTSTDLKDVLFNEPSISFNGGNGRSQWVTIRGMGQDQIDYKVDDTYTDGQIFHHNGRFMFDPALVKVVAAQKSMGSASAGIGTTGDAIIAETVEAKNLLKEGQNVGLRINAGISSNRGYSRGASIYGQAGGFDVLVSGNFVRNKEYTAGKGYRSLLGGDKVLNSGLGSCGLLGKIGYRLNEDSRIELSHRQERQYGERALREESDFSQVFQTDRRTDQYVLDVNGSRIPNTANSSPRYRALTQDTTNLEFKGGNLGFISKIKANVYRLNTKRDEAPNPDYKLNGEVRTYGVNLNLDGRLFDRHTLKYEVNWHTQKSSLNGENSERKNDAGVYVEGTWDFSSVTLITGLRYDRWKMKISSNTENPDGNLNPSIGLVYDITPDFSINTSLNYATHSPHLYEAALANSRPIASSPGLKAERSRNAEIDFNYHWGSALTLSGSYFHQQIKDAQAIRQEGRNYVRYNGGELKNRGCELNAAYRWKGLTACTGVAHSRPKLNGDTADIVTTAIPMGRTWTTGLSHQFGNPNLEVGWHGRYVQNAGYAPTSRGFDVALNVVRAGCGVDDILANWKPTGKDDLSVNFFVNNIFDKNYRPHSQRAGANSLPEPGRDVHLSMNYHF